MSSAGRLAGKRILVTGACGGIGRASVHMFGAEGASVMACDLFEQASPEVVTAFKEIEGVRYHQLDITSEASVRTVAANVRSTWGALDVLFNNAGIILGKPLVETSLEEWDKLQNVNGRGTFLMMREFVPIMTGASPSIINMSSGAGEKPQKNMAPYGAAKAAVVMLTKAAALELAPIRVNAILPGVVDTPMPRKFISSLEPSRQATALAALAEGRALNRLGQPSEIASLAVYLASDESSYMTGSSIVIDGGKA